MSLEIFCILFLSLPLASELYNERNGVNHPNSNWIIRGVNMLSCATVVCLIHPHKNFVQAMLLSFGIFTFLFPYLINIVHYKRKVIIDSHWWNHLSDTAFPDRLTWWKNTPWYGRMFFLAVILAATAKVYACWGKLFSFDNPCY